MDKIKLNLFNLKSKEDLIQVRDFSSKNILRWFNEDKTPKDKYFEIRVCPLCESKESDEVFMVENFSYHRCSNCNSLYTKPHLKDGVLEALYNDGTYQVYQDSLVKKGSTIRKGVLERRKFKQIAQLLDKPEISLLDVGCGGGTFLEVCKENNWKVEGVDPSKESLKKDINITIGDFNTLDFDKKYELNEIISGDSIFCATGITSGDLVSGIEIQNDEYISETLITHKSSGLKKIIKTKQKI